VEQVASWPKRVHGVTADAVREAARAWLDKRRSVAGYLVKELPSTEKHS
jgi:zinc protease